MNEVAGQQGTTFGAHRWGSNSPMILIFCVGNLFNKRYIGSLIVNDASGASNTGQGRYFEGAPGRNWIVGAILAYQF